MCSSTTLIQREKSPDTDAFAERLLDIGNNAGTALMISIGHRTGLFDTLAGMAPATSAEVAAAADLEERYVREWLASMVVAGIVLFDPVRDRYQLPEEHAAILTRAASSDNIAVLMQYIAVLMQYIAVLGSVENDIVDCFKNGGGVPYSRFERFHEVMAEDSGQVVDSMLIEQIIPLVPGLSRRLEEGIDVLDVGCGSGRALHRLAEAFPKSRFTGYDLSPEAIGRASAAGRARGLPNVRFDVRDTTSLPPSERFHLVTAFDAIHDQAHPEKVLGAIHDALRADGVFLMQDIAGSSRLEGNMHNPLAPLFYAVSCMHCMTVSLAAGGAGLGTIEIVAGEEDVGLVASHGHAGGGTKSTRHDQNGFEVDDFRNDVLYLQIKRHARFSFSLAIVPTVQRNRRIPRSPVLSQNPGLRSQRNTLSPSR